MKKYIPFGNSLLVLFIVFSSIAVGQNVPELMYYKFDGSGSSVPNDASAPVGTNPAPLSSPATQGGTGQFGGALIGSSGSSANKVTTGWNLALGTGDWTISMWIKGPYGSSTNYFFGDGTFRAFSGGVAGTGIWLRGGLTDTKITTAITTQPNTPFVITFVYSASAGNIKGYVNGVLHVTQAQSALNLTGSQFMVGNSGSSTSHYGLLDEFRMYNRALDATEIMNTWNHTLPLYSAPNDAGITDILSPVSGCDGTTQDVKVEVSNLGINQINNVAIHWSVNSVAQPTFNYTQLLDTANGLGPDKDTVTIGSLTLTGGLTYNILAWTENPNNITDTVNFNDSSDVTIQGYNYPIVNLGLDTTTCPNDLVTLDAGSGRDSVRWDHGATGRYLLADTARNYSVTVWKNGCSGMDNINVNFYPAPPTVNLGIDTMICYGDSIILDATAPGVTYLWHDNTTGPTHVADTVGNYSVIIEDGNTCKNTDDINVSLFSTPLISMNVIPRNTLCYGAPFEFRANSFTQGSTMYQWKINTVNSGAPTTNNKFSPNLMYGDSVNVDLLTDVCSSTTYAVPSNYITMYLKPEPKLISGSSKTDTVLENTSKNYLVPVVTGSTFTWTAIGGTIGSPVGNAVKVEWGAAMDTAKVMVTEKDAGNCSFTNVRNVVIISIVGVKDEDNLIGIGYAYPNPANTTVTIPLVIDGDWDIDLSLYDMTGKKVKAIYTGSVSGNKDITFAVDDLQSGMYFYKVSTSDGFESVKKLNIKH